MAYLEYVTRRSYTELSWMVWLSSKVLWTNADDDREVNTCFFGAVGLHFCTSAIGFIASHEGPVARTSMDLSMAE